MVIRLLLGKSPNYEDFANLYNKIPHLDTYDLIKAAYIELEGLARDYKLSDIDVIILSQAIKLKNHELILQDMTGRYNSVVLHLQGPPDYETTSPYSDTAFKARLDAERQKVKDGKVYPLRR